MQEAKVSPSIGRDGEMAASVPKSLTGELDESEGRGWWR
uniref:Uncharacterized protein n=1 Tax=Arundo donax TaxID=35708 RepID=A0A0A9FFV8_ARUDO